jgi:hypothetical protein
MVHGMVLGMVGQPQSPSSTSYLDAKLEDDDEFDAPAHRSPEDLADQFGIGASLAALCIGLLIAAIWFVSQPSFEKCSALDNVAERNSCYDQLRSDLLKPPVKGADLRY